MIKLKTKIVGYDDENQYVKIKKYKAKHTTTAEHLCVIDFLIHKIMENQKDMTITKLIKLINENYKVSKEKGEK